MSQFQIPADAVIDAAMRSGAIAFETDADGELVVAIRHVRGRGSPLTLGGIAAALCAVEAIPA